MATPMTPDELVGILRAEGLTVKTVGDFRNHNRNHKGPFGPVHGIMLHHTVSSGSAASVELCRVGYAGLPGPLCHGVIDKAGVVHVISAGRSNHAGGGDPKVLAQVRDESYGTAPTRPTKGNSDGVDGNAHFYGFECVNLGDGKDPWPGVQVDAMVRASAAISRRYGWTEKSAIGHKEWSDDKSDPRGPGTVVDMPVLRGKIKERLAHPASWNPIPPKPLPTPVEPPTPGVPMTAPSRLSLSRSEDVTLVPNSPYTVYWTGETVDDGNEHGAGGKTVATNVAYSAVVRVQLIGLGAGEYVEILPIELNSSGAEIGYGAAIQLDGRTGSVVSRSAAFMGHMGQGLAFKVINRGAQVVDMTAIELQAHLWPNPA